MIQLVHLAPERLRRRIQRAGLRGSRWALAVEEGDTDLPEALFAMAVLEDFTATHQWLRELRRWGRGRMVGVYFRLPADAMVYVGRFGKPHDLLPLGEAVAKVREAPDGAEIVITDRIEPRQVTAIRRLRQDIGWIETPEGRSHFDCVCDYCIPKGTPDLIRRLRAAFEQNVQRLRKASTDEARTSALGGLATAAERAGDRLPVEKILSLQTSPSERVRVQLAHVLSHFSSQPAIDALISLSRDEEGGVRQGAVSALADSIGPTRAWQLLEPVADGELTLRFVDAMDYRDGAKAAPVLRQLASHAEPEVARAASQMLATLDEEETDDE